MTLRQRRSSKGFATAVCSFGTVFAAGTSPLPLYDLYRREGDATIDQLALVNVSYFMAAVLTLLVLGRLSTHVGRRPVTVTALVFALGGCAMLLDVHSVAPLVVGRALLGIATGLASSGVASYVVDTSPPRPAWLGATAAATTPTVGLTMGALVSGGLAEFGPAPRQLPYLMAMAMLVICIIAILAAPETVPRTAGARASLRPQLRVPASVRPLLPVASCLYVATWALGGFYQSFGPTVASDYLGTDSVLVAAVIFAAFMAPTAVAGPLVGALRPVVGQRLGITIFVIAVGGLFTALSIGSATVFITSSVMAGLGMGCVFAATMGLLLPRTKTSERAGLLSVMYTISYTGAAIPSLIAGQASRTIRLHDIALGYGALALAACILTMIATRHDGWRGWTKQADEGHSPSPDGAGGIGYSDSESAGVDDKLDPRRG
jgi:MFS family permease